MLTYSQCQSCGESLLISYVGQESCITCPSTPAEKLCREFVDAVQREDHGEAVRLEKLLNAPPKPVAMGSAALWYVSTAHWPVFPIVPGEKRPLTKRGLHDASLEPDQIREWWTRWPTANIGGVTGIAYDCVDVDGPEGFKSLRDIEDHVPESFGRSNTRRGQHIFIKPTGDGNRAGFRPGLDFRGKSGYVLLPMSQVEGFTYTWAVKPSPEIYGKTAP